VFIRLRLVTCMRFDLTEGGKYIRVFVACMWLSLARGMQEMVDW
jgi:hypothetical protein